MATYDFEGKYTLPLVYDTLDSSNNELDPTCSFVANFTCDSVSYKGIYFENADLYYQQSSDDVKVKVFDWTTNAWVLPKYRSIDFGTKQTITISSTNENIFIFLGLHFINYNTSSDIVNDNETTLRYGEQIDLVDAKRSGYDFVGWYGNSLYTGDKITQISSLSLSSNDVNINLYAKWYEPPRTLKRAFTNYFQDILNQYWKSITTDNENRFSVNCDFESDNGAFLLRKDTGQLVLNNDFDFVKYIPVAVGSFNGELAEIPNKYILDTIIPIEMLVPVDLVEQVVYVLESVQNNLNAKPITLRAIHLSTSNTDITGVLNFNIPDADEFQIIDGINAKIVSFQIVSTFTIGMFYGNSIKYELSLDGGTNYTEIVKITPKSIRESTPYSDQIIGGQIVQSTEATNTWSQTFSMIVNKNDSSFKYLLVLTDFTTDKLDFTNSSTTKATLDALLGNIYFRKTYTFSSTDIIVGAKPVIITSLSYTDDYGEFITIDLALADKMEVGSLT